MKTVIHEYRFRMSEPKEKQAYKALCDALKAQGLKCFETHGGGSHYHGAFLGGREIELEKKRLFNNQWNTAPIDGFSEKGLRVFDWAQDSQYANCGKNIKQGHYLEQTEEMKAERRDRFECGFCGFQTTRAAAKVVPFCNSCTDSEYLKESNLMLTRMRCVIDESEFNPLSESEQAELLPKYREAQIHGSTVRGKARIAKKRADMLARRESALKNANTEFDGFTWLLDRGINTENCIYYGHAGKFSFGWLQAFGAETAAQLKAKLTGFPFPYEVKQA